MYKILKLNVMEKDMFTIDDPQLAKCIIEIGDNGILSEEIIDEIYNTESEENANKSEE